jgi:hypothetical protein
MKWLVQFSCKGGPLLSDIEADTKEEAIERGEAMLAQMSGDEIVKSLAAIDLDLCEEADE